MEQRMTKVQGYVEALIALFYEVELKYALVSPMINDPSVRVRFERSEHSLKGFDKLKHTLVLDVIKDCARLSFDRSKSSPSICNVFQLLSKEELLSAFRDEYCKVDFRLHTPCEFENKYNNAVDCFLDFSETGLSKKFKSVRNKILAHSEMRLINGQYEIAGLDEFDIKWSDPESFMNSVKPIVFELGLLILDCVYAHESFTSSQAKVSESFWAMAANKDG